MSRRKPGAYPVSTVSGERVCVTCPPTGSNGDTIQYLTPEAAEEWAAAIIAAAQQAREAAVEEP